MNQISDLLMKMSVIFTFILTIIAFTLWEKNFYFWSILINHSDFIYFPYYLLIGSGFIFVLKILSLKFKWMNYSVIDKNANLNKLKYLHCISFIVFIPACAYLEEFVFRGNFLLRDGLINVIIGSFLFALIHTLFGYQFKFFFVHFIGGIYLSFIYERGGLELATYHHFLWNIVIILIDSIIALNKVIEEKELSVSNKNCNFQDDFSESDLEILIGRFNDDGEIEFVDKMMCGFKKELILISRDDYFLYLFRDCDFDIISYPIRNYDFFKLESELKPWQKNLLHTRLERIKEIGIHDEEFLKRFKLSEMLRLFFSEELECVE